MGRFENISYTGKTMYGCPVDRFITPEEAKEIIKMLAGQKYWSYKQLADKLGLDKLTTIQTMNDLIHYGLMKFIKKQGKVSVFERCPYGSW